MEHKADIRPNKSWISDLITAGIFWSYDAKKPEDLSDAAIIEHTLLYADVPYLIELFRTFTKKQIRGVWEEKIAPNERHHKLNFYLARIFFGIKAPNPFLKDKMQHGTRLEKLKRLVAQNEGNS